MTLWTILAEQMQDGKTTSPTGLTPGHYSQEGMTLRDWFAGQALAGHISYEGGGSTFDLDATAAYKWADAMILAREATQ